MTIDEALLSTYLSGRICHFGVYLYIVIDLIKLFD